MTGRGKAEGVKKERVLSLIKGFGPESFLAFRFEVKPAEEADIQIGCRCHCFLRLQYSSCYHWAFVVLNMDDNLTRPI